MTCCSLQGYYNRELDSILFKMDSYYTTIKYSHVGFCFIYKFLKTFIYDYVFLSSLQVLVSRTCMVLILMFRHTAIIACLVNTLFNPTKWLWQVICTCVPRLCFMFQTLPVLTFHFSIIAKLKFESWMYNCLIF